MPRRRSVATPHGSPSAPASISATSADGVDSRVRVLLIIGSLAIGGAEKQLVEIALGLDRTRFEPAVCSLSGPGPLSDPLSAAGIPVFSVGIEAIADVGPLRAWAALPKRLWQFLRVVSRFRPHVIQGMLFHAYVLGALAGWLTRCPVVIGSRRSLSIFKQGKPHFTLADRLVRPLTDCVVANSEAVRLDTMATEGLAPDEVLVVHNGIDASRYAGPRDATVRASLGGDGPLAVVLANLIHYKGHMFLVDAWAEVCRHYPDATVVCVGEGPMRGACEARVAALGLTGHVRFVGTRHDVPAILSACDLLVHPSLQEGFSNALLEGMAAGLPVVATTVGGNPEAVIDGVTGHLVPPSDSRALAEAVMHILGLPDRGRAFGRAGRERVLEEYQLDTMVRRYEALYADLLATKERASDHVRYRRTV